MTDPSHPPTDSQGSGETSAAEDHAGPVRRKARVELIDDQAGQRIDNYLHSLLDNVPKSRVYKMLRSGEVRVNGGRKKPVYRLQAGDKVRIPPHHTGPERTPSFISDDVLAKLSDAILFEDEDLLVVDKPAGLAVHGGSGVSFGLIEAMRRIRGDKLELAHRLDRDTSGVLLLTKRRAALQVVHEAIRNGSMSKRYRLIVHGRWPKDLGAVRLPLRKYQTQSGERRVVVAADGKASETRFHALERCSRASLLDADLLTGRTHQIRVHAQASGHAIVGDVKYASDEQCQEIRQAGIERLCLHAAEVNLPWQGSDLQFVSPLPDALVRAWEILRKSA